MPLTDESVMTVLTILGVTEILCNFRLVLERKTGKEIPEPLSLELFKKLSANNLALSDVEENISRLLNGGGIQIYHCWEHYLQFTQSPENQVSGKWWILLLY